MKRDRSNEPPPVTDPMLEDIKTLLELITDRLLIRPADRELSKINETLTAYGFSYPNAARGVADALFTLTTRLADAEEKTQ